MTQLTAGQLHVLRSHLPHHPKGRVGSSQQAHHCHQLVRMGLLETNQFGHRLTQRGEQVALTLTPAEEQEPFRHAVYRPGLCEAWWAELGALFHQVPQVP